MRRTRGVHPPPNPGSPTQPRFDFRSVNQNSGLRNQCEVWAGSAAIACEVGRRCMQNCWLPQVLRTTRQPNRCMSVVLTSISTAWHFRLLSRRKALALALYKVCFQGFPGAQIVICERLGISSRKYFDDAVAAETTKTWFARYKQHKISDCSAATGFPSKITRFTKKFTRFVKKSLDVKFLRRYSQFCLKWFSYLLYHPNTFTSFASLLK